MYSSVTSRPLYTASLQGVAGIRKRVRMRAHAAIDRQPWWLGGRSSIAHG